MPSTKNYLDFVLEQLSELKDISFRQMMGEYILYYQKKVVGGIYDDRFLLKPTKSSMQLMHDSELTIQMALPYDGAKEMLAADIDDRELSCRLIRAIAADLPDPKPKKGNK